MDGITLTDLIHRQRTFMATKDPLDYKAWSDALDALNQEEMTQVGGGMPWMVND